MGQRSVGPRRLIAFLAVIVALLALVVAWCWTPLQDWLSQQRVAEFVTRFSSPGGRALLAVAGVGLASVLMVPLTFLAVVGAVALPGWLGFVYVLAGALVGSAIGFIGGRVMSRGALEPISGSRLGQLSRQLAKRGTRWRFCGRCRSRLLQSSTCWPAPRTPGVLAAHRPAACWGLSPAWAAVSEPTWEDAAIAAAVGLG